MYEETVVVVVVAASTDGNEVFFFSSLFQTVRTAARAFYVIVSIFCACAAWRLGISSSSPPPPPSHPRFPSLSHELTFSCRPCRPRHAIHVILHLFVPILHRSSSAHTYTHLHTCALARTHMHTIAYTVMGGKIKIFVNINFTDEEEKRIICFNQLYRMTMYGDRDALKRWKSILQLYLFFSFNKYYLSSCASRFMYYDI